MNSPQRYLASMERRMAAFAIDSLLLLFSCAFFLDIAESLGVAASPFVMTCLLTSFIAYHSTGLANRHYGIGRVAMGITVISLKSGPELSGLQCLARPTARVLWLLVGIVPAMSLQKPFLLCLPFLADLALLTLHPLRQTVTDLVCRTTVVHTPPQQPHRAPAIPMFSADDIEFGPKPKKPPKAPLSRDRMVPAFQPSRPSADLSFADSTSVPACRTPRLTMRPTCIAASNAEGVH